MQDVEVDLSSKELSNQQKTELQEIAASCRNILAQIEKSIHNYRELKTEDLMRRHTVKRVWKRLKWEPEDIHNLRQRLSSNIVLLNAFNGQITRRNVAELLQIQNSQERYAILDWLSPEIYTTQQSDQISRHQPGTCQWFLHSNEFQSWIKTPKETLFCPGIPGAGKTILASVVVEELYSQYGNTSAIGIAYISCNFRRHEQQDSRGLLANLLRQLAQGQPSLTVNVKKLYDQHKNRGTRPSMEELSRALCFVLCHYARTFLVIDALDECQSSDGSRTRILNEIFGLQYEHNLNFLATSRFIPEITALFNDKPSLEIRAVEEDVSIFLRANLAKLPSFVSRSSKLQDEITSTITKAADGM
jgi:Cdc6-like AAA superfamily ATPase